MKPAAELLEKYWVLKEREKEEYYRLRYAIREVEEFARDYAGWRVINNERLIKYEKIPAVAESFMGITEFQEVLDYQLLCALLIFLEDLEDTEAFLLSELIERMEILFEPGGKLDFTRFVHRKSLVRVMQYASAMHMVIAHEGDIDAVSGDIRREVLYENTGLSRYFAVNYPSDITGFNSVSDFEKYSDEVDEQRGHFRINRVYRTLSTSPAMYWDRSDDADSLYLKNQRAAVSKHLVQLLGGRLDIHRNAAFFVQEDDAYGSLFPTSATVSDVILLICAVLRDREDIVRRADDVAVISREEFEAVVEKCAEKYAPGWSKEFREMSLKKLTGRLIEEMRGWDMIEEEEADILLYPAVFKFSGIYPKDYDPLALVDEKPPAADKQPAGDNDDGDEVEQLSLF